MQARPSRIDYGTNRRGDTMVRRQWIPGGIPRAIVLIVHGIAEHAGRYEAVGRQFAEAGYGAVGIDQRGHGASGGRRRHIERFDEFLDDVEDQMAEIRAIGVPVVLLGHSMGGLISTAYCLSDRPLPDRLVLSGPALGAGMPQWQKTAALKLAQLRPTFEPRLPFDTAVLSRDPAVGEAYLADPLIQPSATVGLVSEIIRTAESTASRVHELSVPTLCLHGGADELVPAAASEVLEGLPGVERRVLPGLRHEIFNEPEGADIVGQVIDWLDASV